MIQHRRFYEESGGVYYKEDWRADYKEILYALQTDLHTASSWWI